MRALRRIEARGRLAVPPFASGRRCLASSSSSLSKSAAASGGSFNVSASGEKSLNAHSTVSSTSGKQLLSTLTSTTTSAQPQVPASDELLGSPYRSRLLPNFKTSTGSTSSKPLVSNKSTLTFEDFLAADLNGDGRVTSAEWESYIKRKNSVAEDVEPTTKGMLIELPITELEMKRILENKLLAVTINGLRYTVNFTPEAKTSEVIAATKSKIAELDAQIEAMDLSRAPLDKQAATHTRRVLSGILMYLLTQSAVVAKLTFFSRFGWDVMEPITYFLTFGISLVGLTFFHVNKLEFSYPALAALLTRRRAEKLYARHGFDNELYKSLKKERAQAQLRLECMTPASAVRP